MHLQKNISLLPYNTFRINVLAKYFVEANSVNEIAEIISYNKTNMQPLLVLGGGSNLLFLNDYNGLVLKNNIKGIEIVEETDEYIYVKANAGENWHSFVCFCVENGFGGIENLSLIPGSVGASPIQNIGAYGVEVKDTIHSVQVYSIKENLELTFSNSDCEFGYRESVFKNRLKNDFIILNVTFKLNKSPKFNTSYGAIEQELLKMNISELNIKNIAKAVVNIRTSKLPNPLEIGNAGSFFKNPIISADAYKFLLQEYPTIPVYSGKNNSYKVAAGWLIEQCNFKGYRKNDAGCYNKQALVLVNYGNASGREIYELSTEIIESVKMKFNIQLEREVNVIQ